MDQFNSGKVCAGSNDPKEGHDLTLRNIFTAVRNDFTQEKIEALVLFCNRTLAIFNEITNTDPKNTPKLGKIARN